MYKIYLFRFIMVPQQDKYNFFSFSFDTQLLLQLFFQNKKKMYEDTTSNMSLVHKYMIKTMNVFYRKHILIEKKLIFYSVSFSKLLVKNLYNRFGIIYWLILFRQTYPESYDWFTQWTFETDFSKDYERKELEGFYNSGNK